MQASTGQSVAALAGLVAVPVVAWSEFTLKTTGKHRCQHTNCAAVCDGVRLFHRAKFCSGGVQACCTACMLSAPHTRGRSSRFNVRHWEVMLRMAIWYGTCSTLTSEVCFSIQMVSEPLTWGMEVKDSFPQTTLCRLPLSTLYLPLSVLYSLSRHGRIGSSHMPLGPS